MNVLLKLRPSADSTRIVHSVMGYDRASDTLDVELPIPVFLDTLALKIARVPPGDKYGALSYPLDAKTIDTFRFLLGLDVDTSKREYLLEPTVGHTDSFGPKKLRAVQMLTEGTPRSSYDRSQETRISERELVVPTLRLLDQSNTGWTATRDLISQLTDRFSPSGQDAAVLERRNDTYFSQKVRNIVSHRHQPSSFISRGLASYKPGGLRITDQGRLAVQALLS